MFYLNPSTPASGRYFFGHNSPAARAREVFKPSMDSARLLCSISCCRVITGRASH